MTPKERMPRERINVSPEMLSFVGSGPIVCDVLPVDAMVFGFRFNEGSPTFHYGRALVEAADAPVVLVVASHACQRIFGSLPEAGGVWHLPANLALLALSLHECAIPEPARATLRLAKSIELLCGIFASFADGSLIAADGVGDLSERDSARLAAARRLVDERWQEKLTLDGIARACGLNRAKLTRGFREAFGSTVADAIADRRLQGARRLLIATDLPVSSIGYRCGYSNNASFTRAFSRRFGMAPTHLRQLEAAA